MKYRIVSDSAANLYALEGVDFASVPLKIITGEREYVDAPGLDVARMVEELQHEKGASRTSCPNPHEWLEAFSGSDAIFALTISSALSGSHAAAVHAREEFLQAHPEAKVCVIDSLSAGAEMLLIVEKLRLLIQRGLSFEEIEREIAAYRRHTHVLFCLQSLNNRARNGRISPAMAKIAGVLGIRVLGKGSEEGQLQALHKCRGEKRMLETTYAEMKKAGFAGGRVHIAHCLNEPEAQQLRERILEEQPGCAVTIGACTGLCSFYAEKGGLIVGYEDAGAH